jgi:hypothetical protein
MKSTHKTQEPSLETSVDLTQDFLTKLQEKVRFNLSTHLNGENNRREKQSKSELKSIRSEKVKAKRKSELLQKKLKDFKKQEEFQKRIDSLLMIQREKSKKWDEKLSRNSSKVISLTPRMKTRQMASLVDSEGHEHSFHDSSRHSEQQNKSINIHSFFIRNRSEKSACHNEIVEKTLKNHVSACEDEEEKKLMNMIQKYKRVEKYKVRKEKYINSNISRVNFKVMQQLERVKSNLKAEDEKMLQKLEKIDEKSQETQEKLASHYSHQKHENSIKSLKNFLKTTETQATQKLLKQGSILKQSELFQKHIKDSLKLTHQKHQKEVQNQKTRIEASLANQELIRQKHLQLKIQLSEDPGRYSKLIESYSILNS